MEYVLSCKTLYMFWFMEVCYRTCLMMEVDFNIVYVNDVLEMQIYRWHWIYNWVAENVLKLVNFKGNHANDAYWVVCCKLPLE